jgi:hypothetical protein
MTLKIITHGRFVQRLASSRGWGCGARYTNLRDVREQTVVAMIDIDWKNYSFRNHIRAVRSVRPFMTVIRDIDKEEQYERTLAIAEIFFEWVQYVIIVPKFSEWSRYHESRLSSRHIVGYSIPTRYGATALNASSIKHQVQLLGGRPDRQRLLGDQMDVVSIDCNRFTLDASFGDYFNGRKYVYSRKLDYRTCLSHSMSGIEYAWSNYELSKNGRFFLRRWLSFCAERGIGASLGK